jgi:hypothetical protein
VKTLQSLFDGKLVRQARLFEAMTSSLRLHLPPEVGDHCWIGGVHERTLVVVTDSASFATLVHYQQQEVLKRINSDFRMEIPAPLQKLKLRIAKLAPQTQRPLPRRTSASGAARDTREVTDLELEAALKRLVRRRAAPRSR